MFEILGSLQNKMLIKYFIIIFPQIIQMHQFLTRTNLSISLSKHLTDGTVFDGHTNVSKCYFYLHKKTQKLNSSYKEQFEVNSLHRHKKVIHPL